MLAHQPMIEGRTKPLTMPTASQARGSSWPDSRPQPELLSGQCRILGYLDAEDKQRQAAFQVPPPQRAKARVRGAADGHLGGEQPCPFKREQPRTRLVEQPADP